MERPALLKQMIHDYRRKVDTYLAMIHEWELEIDGRLSTARKKQRVTRRPRCETPIASIDIRTGRQFVGKSQPQAARALLERVKRPLTTDEIMSGIQRGGAVVKSSKRNFYWMLDRHKDFTRVGRNTWCLAGSSGALKEKHTRRAKRKRVEGKPEAREKRGTIASVTPAVAQTAVARDARAS